LKNCFRWLSVRAEYALFQASIEPSCSCITRYKIYCSGNLKTLTGRIRSSLLDILESGLPITKKYRIYCGEDEYEEVCLDEFFYRGGNLGDCIVNFNELFSHYNKVLQSNGTLPLTILGSQSVSSTSTMSEIQSEAIIGLTKAIAAIVKNVFDRDDKLLTDTFEQLFSENTSQFSDKHIRKILPEIRSNLRSIVDDKITKGRLSSITTKKMQAAMGSPEHYNQSWRATGNGLEGIAKFHNDTCLIIDEMGQVQAREAGEISYMLANGSGKLRANIRGEAREKASWRLLFLSSGEVTLAEHMNEGGKKARAGMEIRLVDIPADAGKDMGIFENIHGVNNGAEFSDILKACTTEYHGTAYRSFIKRVIAEDDLIRAIVGELQEDFLENRVPKDASGQVRRVATRFALIAAAGELATRYDITGWEAGEATRAVNTCFEAWLELRGGTGQQESKSLLDQVRGFFEQFGDSRFIEVRHVEGEGNKLVDQNQRVINRAGFRRIDSEGNTMFLVLPEAFREICEGFNIRAAAKILIEKGVITPGKNGRSQVTARLPGMGIKKVYSINASIWQEREAENASGNQVTG
jgi:hypothetical protein